MKNNNKTFILIGSWAYYSDSLKYFIENGYDCYCIKVDSTPFKKNYNLLEKIGFKIINYKSKTFNEVLKTLPLENAIVTRAGYFGNSQHIANINQCSHVEMDIFYELTEYAFKNNINLKSVLTFNGDSYWTSDEERKFFSEKAKYATACIYDSDKIKEFAIENIPLLAVKKDYVAWIECPLERFIKLRKNFSNSQKKVLRIGRLLNNIPFNKTYLGKNRRIFNFSCSTLYCKLKLLRWIFSLSKRPYFGLSHFYNAFEDNKNDDWITIDSEFKLPKNYPTNNVSGKDVTFLMLGIIPLIPEPKNNVYKYLIDNKMAICIKNKEDFDSVINMPISEVREYALNIYKNRDFFAFEKIGKIYDEVLGI